MGRISRSHLALLAVAATAGCGSDVGGPAASLYACVFANAQSLAVGQAIRFSGTGGQSVCLTSAEDGAAFLYVPFLATPPASPDAGPARLAVEVLGGGVLSGPVAAAPAVVPPGWATPGPSVDHDFHRRLREREVEELEPKLRGGPPRPGPVPEAALAPAVAAVPQVGDHLEFNVALSCSASDVRTGRVVRVSQQAIVVADVQNPAGFTQADYDHFAVAFDTLVHPMATRHFGTPTDIDGNGRIIIFFTRAVNQLSEPGSSTITVGMFWSGDLFPATPTPRLEACPAANQAEMFYMAVPDPAGSTGPVVTLSWLRERAVQVIGHEYQHLLNSARRMYVNEAQVFERTWLNEGLSHVAEELLFYEATGLGPRSNLARATLLSNPGITSAFNHYMGGNAHNLRLYLARPDTLSPMGPDGLETRGATWSFLRYAADRTGANDESVFFDLVNSLTAGVDNLTEVLGAPALEWMSDWAVSLYADDRVPGVDPRFTQPSWNFRDILSAAGQTYPLVPRTLAPGDAQSLSLESGGAGHFLFGVPLDGRAAIHVDAGGSSPPRTLRGTFLRVR